MPNQWRTTTEPKIRNTRNTRTTATAVGGSPTAWPAAAVVQIENMLRDFGSEGVQYAAKCTDRQQQLGRTVDEIRSLIVQAEADGVKAHELAKHLIHGSKLPPPRRRKAATTNEAERLWRALHGQWCDSGKPCSPGELQEKYIAKCAERGLEPV